MGQAICKDDSGRSFRIPFLERDQASCLGFSKTCVAFYELFTFTDFGVLYSDVCQASYPFGIRRTSGFRCLNCLPRLDVNLHISYFKPYFVL